MSNVLMVGDDITLKSGIALQMRFIAKVLMEMGHTVSVYGFNANTDRMNRQEDVFFKDWGNVKVGLFGPKQATGGIMQSKIAEWMIGQEWDALIAMSPDYVLANFLFFKHLNEVLSHGHGVPMSILYFVWDPGLVGNAGMGTPEILQGFDLIVPATAASRKIAQTVKSDFHIHAPICHAVDTDFWRYPSKDERAAAKAKNGIDKQVILWSGRAMHRKNLGLALQVAKCREIITHLLLHASANDPWYASIPEMIKALDVQNITWVPNELDEEQYRELFWGADLFLNTSKMEGVGCPMIQALCCGLQVFATNTNGSCELQALMEQAGDQYAVVIADMSAAELIVSDPRSLVGMSVIGAAEDFADDFFDYNKSPSADMANIAKQVFGEQHISEQWRSLFDSFIGGQK